MVVLADDDSSMRRAMREALDAHGGFEVAGEVADCADLGDLVAATSPDLVVLDVRMPSGGPTAARWLTALRPALVVVAVSGNAELATVVAMVRAGATGFLVKGRLGQSFAEDLARIAAGHVVIAVPRASRVISALTGPAPPTAAHD